jgi:hypothetical protein
MSIAVECSSCKTVAQVPDSAAGAQGKCRKCGRLVHVPVKKICNVCGADVSGLKRHKDCAGNYFCEPCWEKELANDPATVLVAAVPAESKYHPGYGIWRDGNTALVLPDLSLPPFCIRCGDMAPVELELKRRLFPRARSAIWYLLLGAVTGVGWPVVFLLATKRVTIGVRVWE